MSSSREFHTSPSDREIFLTALDKVDPNERAEYLANACGSDNRLRGEVEAMLRETEVLGGFLEEPAIQVARNDLSSSTGDATLVTPVTEQPGDLIGRYKLVQKLGEGGCGVVYRAEQEQPLRREVALKIIKLGMDTKQVIARFEAERQALALMDHPNIARVFDAGATEAGRPFFVMELVRGVKLTEYCDQAHLNLRERLVLFAQVCQAVQHAHQKGIIHRDLKPSNILISTVEGRAVPKIIDFGIAKATDPRGLDEPMAFTQVDQVIGTPAYMSPEQADRRVLDIDTRSDIYSLGVLLYELLTGRTPFDGAALLRDGIEEFRRVIREVEPQKPSTRLLSLGATELEAAARHRRSTPKQLAQTVRGDLDWIGMKALEKDRTRRYATAAAFSQDVEYFLSNEPVLARPPSNLYRLRKMVRRRRGAVFASGGILMALLVGAGISFWQAIRATRAETEAHTAEQTAVQLRRRAEYERERAQGQAELARINEYTADINLAQQSLAAGNYGRAVRLLQRHQPQPNQTDLRGFEWRYLWQLSKGDDHVSFPNQNGSVRWVAFSPSGAQLAIGSDHRTTIWKVDSRTLVRTLELPFVSGVFSADNRKFMAGTVEGVRIFDTETWAQTNLPGTTAGPVALSRDGGRLATPGKTGVVVWETQNWTATATLPGAAPPFAFSGDGRLLATGARGGITVWDWATATPVTLLKHSPTMFGRGAWDQLGRVIAFTPDTHSIIAPRSRVSSNPMFALGWWDVESGEEAPLPGEAAAQPQHTGTIAWMAISPDGQELATASMDHSIQVRDLPAGRLIATLHGHLSEVWAVAFSPDSRTLVSGAKDGSVSLWSRPYSSKKDSSNGSRFPVAFSPNGRSLAVLDPARGRLRFLNSSTLASEKELSLEEGGTGFGPRFALSADFGTLAESLRDGRIRLVDTTTGSGRFLNIDPNPVTELALSPDGLQLFTAASGQPSRWWDLPTGTNLVLHPGAQRALFSPDGGKLAIFVQPDTVELWDPRTRTRLSTLRTGGSLGIGAAFSSDGRLLALASNPMEAEQSIQIWDTTRAQPVGTCIGHKQGIIALAFTPDGRTLASASHDSTLKLWNVGTQQELLSFSQNGLGFGGLLFSPSGTVLVATQFSPDPGIRFYRAPSNEAPDSPATIP
jgi:eukaryotic-like serine/threonine-protein kinase